MSLDEAHSRADQQTSSKSNEVMLFMKGNPQAPPVRLLGHGGADSRRLSARATRPSTCSRIRNVRDGIKAFSSWPTIPQLYVKGEFVGGCDIIKEMAASGELFEARASSRRRGRSPRSRSPTQPRRRSPRPPSQHGGPDQVASPASVDRGSFQSSLNDGRRAAALDVEVESNGITLLIDRMSAAACGGDRRSTMVDTPPGSRLQDQQSQRSPQVGDMSVQALQQGTRRIAVHLFELIDVRTPRGARNGPRSKAESLTDRGAIELKGWSSLPKSTRLVFFCHHGPRGDCGGRALHSSLGFQGRTQRRRAASKPGRWRSTPP